jgi:translocation and assembly module TamA
MRLFSVGLAFAATALALPVLAQAVPQQPAEIDPLGALPPIDADLGLQWLETGPDAPAAEDVPLTDAEVRYRVRTEGLADIGLDQRFDALSELAKSRTAENAAQLDRRARADTGIIERLLRAGGYYAATTTIAIEPATDRDPLATVTLTVEPGPQYVFALVDVRTPTPDTRELALDALGLKRGEPVDSGVIEGAEERVRLRLPQRGYPFVRVGDRSLEIDHEAQQGFYAVPVDVGPRARIGQITLDSRLFMGPKHVGRLARFKPGDLYDQRQIEDLRRALVATGLFSTVSVRPVRSGAAIAADGDAIVDVAVNTQPAPTRTLAGQGGYSTGEGLRVEASWQHRALVRPEGALTVRGVVGTQEQRLATELRFSNFRERDRTLLLTLAASNEKRDAFDARSVGVGGRLERETNLIWQKTWTYSLGAELLASDERDFSDTLKIFRRRTFLIGALPSSLSYDGTEDLLDPKSGFRLAGRISPEASFQGSAFGYLKAQIDGSYYRPVSDRVVLAARARVGSIAGASLERIAPSRLFYAGGGGSVRGFGFQELGPRDAFNDPVGGRSLFEASAEARVRFGDFGVVPFVDIGQLYTGTLPTFGDPRAGVGVGARYYSSFGPIRIDVATPLGRRTGEPLVAVYVSIGQAF